MDGIIQKKRRKTGWIIGGIFVILLAAVVTFLILLLSDPRKGQSFSSGKTQQETAGMLAQGVLTGESVALDEEHLNDLLTEDLVSYLSTDSFTVQAVHMTLTENSLLEIYLPVNVKGINLAITMTVNPSCTSDQIQFQIEKIRVGYLPIPTEWGLEMLKSRLPSKIVINADTISIPSQIRILQTQAGETAAMLQVTDLEVSGENRVLYIKVEADIQGLKDYFSDIINDWLN